METWPMATDSSVSQEPSQWPTQPGSQLVVSMNTQQHPVKQEVLLNQQLHQSIEELRFKLKNGIQKYLGWAYGRLSQDN